MSLPYLVTSAEQVTVKQKYDKVRRLYLTFKDIEIVINRSSQKESAALAKTLKEVKAQIAKLGAEVLVGIEKIKKSDVEPGFRALVNATTARMKELYNGRVTNKVLVDVKDTPSGLFVGYSAALVITNKEKSATVLIYENSHLGGDGQSMWFESKGTGLEPKVSFSIPDRYYGKRLAVTPDDVIHNAVALAGSANFAKKGTATVGVLGEVLKVFPKAKTLENGVEFWIEGNKEVPGVWKSELRLASHYESKLAGTVQAMGNTAEKLGIKASGSLSFEEIDYYEGTGTYYTPVYRLRDSKLVKDDQDHHTIPKAWDMTWSFSFLVPKDSKLKEADFAKFTQLALALSGD